MDLAFIRNQIELKLSEIQSLNNLYIGGIRKELDRFEKVATAAETEEIAELLQELEECRSGAETIKDDFDMAVTRLTLIYQDLTPKLNEFIHAHHKSMTAEDDGISITRIPLTWSMFAESAGYNKGKMMLDITFKTGGIYRYYNVPVEFADKLLSRRGFKGFKNELGQFEVKKIDSNP